MRILRYSDTGYRKKVSSLNRRSIPSPDVSSTVTEILSGIESRGDKALCEYTHKFGGPKLTPAKLSVSQAEVESAVAGLPARVRKAILAARTNVRDFARQSLRESWFTKNKQGVITGERFDPFPRVGIYIPGGTAPLVSTAVMTCTIAATAGVPEIAAVTPAAPDGKVHPSLLAALALCGATEIYRVGGAQAIGALAIGTKTIAPVTKVFGPGNAYVVEAKRQVFGRVAVDLLPGPSEVLVIADEYANPDWVAADLLAQSEHGHGSISVLLSPSAALIDAVRVSVERQAAESARREFLADALQHATLVQTADMAEAVEIANAFASEHVSIATNDPGVIAGELHTSGCIFLGGISPVAGGDFLAGPSHELPTGGACKSFAGLTADQFQRRTSLVRFDEDSLRKSLPHLKVFSEIEGLDAHGRSASIRLPEKKRS